MTFLQALNLITGGPVVTTCVLRDLAPPMLHCLLKTVSRDFVWVPPLSLIWLGGKSHITQPRCQGADLRLTDCY